jgi:hypothetical protein
MEPVKWYKNDDTHPPSGSLLTPAKSGRVPPIGRHGFYDALPTNPPLSIFDELSLYEVERMSASLTISEVLDYYGLIPSDLTDDPLYETDLLWFTKAFNRGRTKAKILASERLFQQMTSKTGTQASILWLSHFAKNFESNSDPNTLSSGKFSFTVDLSD